MHFLASPKHSRYIVLVIYTVLLTAIATVVWVSPYLGRTRFNAWRAEFRKIDQLLEELTSSPPKDTSASIWKGAVGRLRAGFWNACHSPDGVSQDQLRQLREKIERITDDVATDHTLVVIWDTIGTSSVSAGKHIAEFRGDFVEHLPSIVAESEIP